MARMNDLIRGVAALNPQLAKDIAREYDAVASRRAFGLNFERHTPEAVELPGRPVRVGDKVHVLPERGQKRADENRLIWTVESIVNSAETRVAHIIRELPNDEIDEVDEPVEGLVVIAEFRDPIYPGLVSTGRFDRGGDKPFHSVINAENFHALETLMFTHRGKIDVIAIDPPYNTGKDTWSYNDNYVEANDTYRHSKWLAFMERRLLLAKELMKDTGLILINIDDSEMARLKLLCDQVFGSDNYVACLVWKSKSGGANDAGLAVDHEYVLIYRSSPLAQVLADATAESTTSYNLEDEVGRYSLERLDKQNLRYSAALDFVILDNEGNEHRPSHKDPLRPNATWRWSRKTIEERFDELVFKAGFVYTKNYEKSEYVARSLLIDEKFGRSRTGGTDLKRVFSGVKVFDYPKPVKLIEHLLGISAPKDAIVVDFFGGSGTTTLATMALNKSDGGSRTSILVTNNELSKNDSDNLKKAGRRAGDPDWEAKGVFAAVCQPRIKAELLGKSVDGGLMGDGFEENVEFFDLTYEDSFQVTSNLAFERIAPLLWLRAGSRGRRIDAVESRGWDVTECYGVLFDLDQTDAFASAVADKPSVTHAFILTDEDRLFEALVRELPDQVEVLRLYDGYVRNFELEAMRVTR